MFHIAQKKKENHAKTEKEKMKIEDRRNCDKIVEVRKNLFACEKFDRSNINIQQFIFFIILHRSYRLMEEIDSNAD